MALRRIVRCFVYAGCVVVAAAQTVPQPQSTDYAGTMGSIHLVLHLKAGDAGQLTATLDSPDQGASGIPADGVRLTAGHLAVTFPSLHALYAADESADGETLTGTWTQGSPTPLILHRQEPFVPAAKPSPIDGDWTGALPTGTGSLHLLLHIKSDRRGNEFLTFDSPAQNATGLIADNIVFTGRTLTFDLAAVHGRYTGQLTMDGSTLSGTWTQGAATPLAFTHIIPFVPAAKPSSVDGEWTGTIVAPKGDLQALLHVRSDRTGAEYITLDSPDQLATGYEATHIQLQATRLSFDVPQLHGTFSGIVTSNTLEGTWTQITPVPAHFTHPSATRTAPPNTPPAAIQYVDLQARLDTELKPLIENPTLAGAHDVGVAIGILHHGQRLILTYGTATPTSLFEIGSITKTFTGLLLAQAVSMGTVQLDTPVRTLLPPNTVFKPDGPEVTLLSLATHHSGLPRLPDNMRRANPDNPYADYTLPDLYTFISTHGAARRPGAPFLYSNAGAALLGQALAAHAGLPYEALLQRGVLAPLHLDHTWLALPEAARTNLLSGHTEDDSPTPAWDLNAIAPAGGLHANIADLLAYTEAQLHPPASLAAAITLQHRVQADTPTGKIALFWFFDPVTGDFSHGGATGGFTSSVFFNPEQDLGAVVLVNRSSALADSLALQISALLEGRTPDPLRH